MDDFPDDWWSDPDNVFVDVFEDEPLTPVEAAHYNRRKVLGLLAVALVVLSLVR